MTMTHKNKNKKRCQQCCQKRCQKCTLLITLLIALLTVLFQRFTAEVLHKWKMLLPLQWELVFFEKKNAVAAARANKIDVKSVIKSVIKSVHFWQHFWQHCWHRFLLLFLVCLLNICLRHFGVHPISVLGVCWGSLRAVMWFEVSPFSPVLCGVCLFVPVSPLRF